MASGQRPHQPRIQVNDESKVSELDTELFEEVPTGGGQFSAWRRNLQVNQSDAEPTGAGDTRQGPPGARGQRPLLSPQQRRLRRRRRALLGSVLVLLATAALAAVVFFSPLLAVRTIQVEGASLTDEAEVAAHLEHFQGVPMTRISDQDVMDSLGALPQVRSVHVMSLPGGELVVHLTERVPVAAVQGDDGWSLVDQEGAVLQTVTDREDLQVPVIEGGAEILGTEDFRSVSAVLSTLPSSLLEQVDSAKAKSDTTVDLELDGGITVRWGDASRSALKAEVLAQLVGARDQTGAVNIYDVSSPEHPVLG